jgi:hypothetical protein
MQRPNKLGGTARLGALAIIGSLILPAPALHAFPPAPFHTLYGMVRDENGQALRADGGQIVFYRDGVEFLRTPISETSRLDQNYQIRLRMDMQRLGTQSYTNLANATGGSFTLGVVLNNIVYYPIEMSASRTVGRPGERIRLDLTLGVDSDGDGIPDAWEQSQLYAGGVMPGDNGWDLSLIDRDGDFDGDGISNWKEYIAGTFATDPTDYLALQITETTAAHARLRFFGIYNKVYSLESSTDLRTWTPATVFLSNPEPPPPVDPNNNNNQPVFVQPEPLASVRSELTDFIDLYAPSDASGRTFYRLKVR